MRSLNPPTRMKYDCPAWTVTVREEAKKPALLVELLPGHPSGESSLQLTDSRVPHSELKTFEPEVLPPPVEVLGMNTANVES